MYHFNVVRRDTAFSFELLVAKKKQPTESIHEAESIHMKLSHVLSFNCSKRKHYVGEFGGESKLFIHRSIQGTTLGLRFCFVFYSLSAGQLPRSQKSFQ